MKRLLIRLVVLYLSWLGMLAVHELGHVIHAMVSRGRVTATSFPLLGFSQTFVDPNPHPQFVAWGGPVWGCLLPVLGLVVCLALRRKVAVMVWFFTGFCLICNGAYIGLGWMKQSGDAHDLIREGAPVATLIAFGVIGFVGGLFCWHQIPSHWWRMRS
jgi:mannose/fructose/N-acetylgalactosamine-specific phosphotransferase system component IIC